VPPQLVQLDGQGRIDLAVYGALAAVVVVAGAGFAVRAPLARVPENTLKFAVGAMLSTFGVFWAAEGAGVRWPGVDAAILVLLAGTLLVSFAAVALLRRSWRRRQAALTPSDAPVEVS
jgi:uncharacterized membrane protein